MHCAEFFPFKLRGFWGRSSLTILFLATGFTLLGGRTAHATPTAEIANAVAVGGAPDVSAAPADIFMRALTAVLVRVPANDLPLYATAAVEARADFSIKIAETSLRVLAGRAKQSLSENELKQIAAVIDATVTARPTGAVTIVAAAIRILPAARERIIVAASTAAPDQKSQIAAAAKDYTVALLSLGLLRTSAEDSTMNGAGFNPSNSSKPKDGDDDDGVVSPERPPKKKK